MTPQRLHKRALGAINQGRALDAIGYCDRLIKLTPDLADAWFLKAMALLAVANLESAQQHIDRAIELEPNNSEYLAHGAKVALALEQLANAKHLALNALEQTPIKPLSLDTIGVVLTKLGEYQSATQALQKAVHHVPNNAQFRFNLASALQFIGAELDAEQQYQKAIELRPGFARAYWALSELHKTSTEPKFLEQLEQAANRPKISPVDNLYFSHALAREQEKNGQYAQSFARLVKAKTGFGEQLNYTPERDKVLFAAIKNSFSGRQPGADDLTRGSNCIFVVGMPRTGTTLVDRILNSHSSVCSLGELQNFPVAINKYIPGSGIKALKPELYSHINSEQFQAIGNEYLQSLGPQIDRQPFVIDKTPLNFIHIGFIRMALPGAKIIVLRRNALDTCLSNFRQLFSLNSPYYQYSFNIIDTAEYFCLFNDLMHFWRDRYPSTIHEIQYESLVAQPRENTEKLLAACGLEWQESCLNFHKNSDAVATASAMQVRQPINTTAVARWRKYEQQLAPLLPIFERAGIQV